MKIEKIAVKTKIVRWSVLDGKELLDFDVLDFSPEQVGYIERIIREKDNSVNIIIEPEQKKLQFAGIKSNIRLVSMTCRENGQRLKIADFYSPDERATGIKKIIMAETPVLVTIEIQQGKLFNKENLAVIGQGSANNEDKSQNEEEFNPVAEPSAQENAEALAAAEDAIFEKPKRCRKIKKIKSRI
jgi:hypothetical protein